LPSASLVLVSLPHLMLPCTLLRLWRGRNKGRRRGWVGSASVHFFLLYTRMLRWDALILVGLGLTTGPWFGWLGLGAASSHAASAESSGAGVSDKTYESRFFGLRSWFGSHLRRPRLLSVLARICLSHDSFYYVSTSYVLVLSFHAV
jgi:hypothetical protein